MSTEFDSAGSHTRPLAYVVDGDFEITRLVSRMLATCDFIPRQFADPMACLRRIRDTCSSARPNVIALDLSFRQFDAVDVIRQLEKLKLAGKVLLISSCGAGTLNEVQAIAVLHWLKMLPCLKNRFEFNSEIPEPDH
jgi:FixJ family two-component response regulator